MRSPFPTRPSIRGARSTASVTTSTGAAGGYSPGGPSTAPGPRAISTSWCRPQPSASTSIATQSWRLARSRSFWPGLNQGTYRAGSDTGVPVLGLRLTRARRKRSVKQPKPRISIRPPPARHSGMCSSIILTASSTSRSTSRGCFFAMRWISADFVIGALSRVHRGVATPPCLRGASPRRGVRARRSHSHPSPAPGPRSPRTAPGRPGSSPDSDARSSPAGPRRVAAWSTCLKSPTSSSNGSVGSSARAPKAENGHPEQRYRHRNGIDERQADSWSDTDPSF